ncbi:MAG: type II secretion system F family protein, partial [Planctomycetales bacterium]|nr:type II secretion system F family protein [Planctomycetales bacterium]
YVARDATGKNITGSIAAATEREAIAQLAGRSLFPIRVTEDKPKTNFRSRGRVNGQILSTFYGQLSSLLRSGVPLLRSLALLRDQSSNAAMKSILDDIHGRVEDGSTLGDAMGRHAHVFREVTVSMVQAGTEGGFLEDALDRVAQFTEEQEDLKGRTMGALAYPIFLACFGTCVIVVIFVFFVPMFAEMFERMRASGQLPAPTIVLLWISDTLHRWAWLIAIGLVTLFFIIRRQLATEAGRRWADRWRLKLPVLGGIFKSLAVARVCRVLGTLIHNGVPILRSLEISSQAAGNRLIGDVLTDAGDLVSKGESLANPLSRSDHFPVEIVEMVSVAEESNTLDTVLVEIADRLERRTSRRLDLFVRLLEPLLLLVMAGIVMFVVLALLLPILKMSSSL